MDVVLFVVDSFTLILLAELLVMDASVLDVAVDSDVAAALVGDGLEESRATRAWTTDDENHLTRLGDTVKF